MQEKVNMKEVISQSATLVKDFHQRQHQQAAPNTAVPPMTADANRGYSCDENAVSSDDPYVVVVSGLDPTYASRQYLTVRPAPDARAPPAASGNAASPPSVPLNGVAQRNENTPCDKSLASAIPERVGSASSSNSTSQETYKSSSESGRGTLRSDANKGGGASETVSPHDATSLDSDRSDSYNKSATRPPASNSNFGVVEKVQQDLNRILDDSNQQRNVFFQQKRNRNPMPVVIESESGWQTDSSAAGIATTRQAVSTKPQPLNGTAAFKAAANKQSVTGGEAKKAPVDKKGSAGKIAEKTKPSYLRGQKAKLPEDDRPKRAMSYPKTKAWLDGAETASTTTCNDFDDNDDDVVSELTVDGWDANDAAHTTHQIKKLHDMYGEVICV